MNHPFPDAPEGSTFRFFCARERVTFDTTDGPVQLQPGDVATFRRTAEGWQRDD